jgi:hypothetical protein
MTIITVALGVILGLLLFPIACWLIGLVLLALFHVLMLPIYLISGLCESSSQKKYDSISKPIKKQSVYGSSTQKRYDSISKPIKKHPRSFVPSGDEGNDWLIKYALEKQNLRSLSIGYKVVTESFEQFSQNEIVTVTAIGRNSCNVNNFTCSKKIVAAFTQPVDPNGLAALWCIGDTTA